MAPNTLKRYQIIREIARSNDIVYEAHDPQTGRRIAIKELAIPPGLVGQARRERIERFRREGRAAGALSPHPHIVTIFDVDNEGDRYFIAMEYLEGQPLRDVLQMEGPLPVERARQIALQVCEGLHHAHARGVIHRDIKPDNIHILPGDVVKLTDFGIARIAADPSITSDGQVFGTPSYMSPEQIAGKPLDARTDIYSLGVTLYEMLAGRKPFTGDSVVTITYNIINQEPPPLVGVPLEVQQVVLRAMAKEPEARFPSAAALRDALANARALSASPRAGSGAQRTLPPGDPSLAYVASPAPAPSGPEPTQQDPPPLYIPRRPSWFASTLKRHGQFLSLLVIAILLSLACVLFIWAGNKAYQSYQVRVRETRAVEHVQAGVSFFERQRYEDALAEFQRAMEAAPGSRTAEIARGNAAAACINLGNARLRGRPAQAVQYYRRALQFDPQSAVAHHGLGMALHNANDVEGAIAEWEWVLKNAPFDPVAVDARHSLAAAHYERGVAAFNAGDHEGAAEAWSQCIRTDPNSSAARHARDALLRIPSRGPRFYYR
ncbi:MAG TPA: protein kinase [Armatimonadetes bacterium]|nr:protein kinase [Armatimonadota bacterium]